MAFLLVTSALGMWRDAAAAEAFPRVLLVDTAGHERTLPDPATGRGPLPLVVVHEDDTSAKAKQPAHGVVGRYADNPANRAVFELVAVADMDRFNYWPAKKYALASLQRLARDNSTTMWIDWLGALRKALSLRKHETSFFVIDATGTTVFFAQGKLDGGQLRALDAAIAALGARPVPGR